MTSSVGGPTWRTGRRRRRCRCRRLRRGRRSRCIRRRTRGVLAGCVVAAVCVRRPRRTRHARVILHVLTHGAERHVARGVYLESVVAGVVDGTRSARDAFPVFHALVRRAQLAVADRVAAGGFVSGTGLTRHLGNWERGRRGDAPRAPRRQLHRRGRVSFSRDPAAARARGNARSWKSEHDETIDPTEKICLRGAREIGFVPSSSAPERFVAAIPLPRHSDRTWARADAGCRDVTAGNGARGDDARWVSASEKIHVAPVSSE